MKRLFEMSPSEQTALAEERLRQIYPQVDIDLFLPLIFEINRQKRKKNAIILGHNYMSPEVFHGVSDYIGDSLGLARQAALSDADIILFNGVYFMAESAKILNPQKKVLIADETAGCSLADNITAEDVQAMRRQHPGVPVVTYINSSAAVKAESDICCTSANAVKVINSLPDSKIIFIPDSYLAANVALETDKEVVAFQGSCEVHRLFTRQDIEGHVKQWPGMVVLAHPECSVEVTAMADFSGSTTAMIDWVQHHPENKEIMLITECSMGDNIRAELPDRRFIGTCHLCPHMKKITLQKVLRALEEEHFEVQVEEELRLRALGSLERMLAI